jgi:signal peptide peptidase-like protein 2B
LSSPTVLIALRGDCTFSNKIHNAAAIGAKALIVINTNDSEVGMFIRNNDQEPADMIPALMIPVSEGTRLQQIINSSKNPVHATITSYVRSVFDWSFICMFAIALFTTIIASYLSSTKERQQASLLAQPLSPIRENNVGAHYLDMRGAISFIFVASLGLLSLYLFLHYLIYFLLFMFAFAAFESLVTLFSLIFVTLMQSLCFSSQLHRTSIHLKITSINLSTLLSIPLAAFICVWWGIHRHDADAWVLQDLMGVAILISVQQILRLPNIKIASTLLTLAFVYDIFWVFISPYFFASSVMMNVASGGGTRESIPMLLLLPRLNDELGGYTMLGLGDIALPGLFIAYCLRFDYRNCKAFRLKDGYWLTSVLGYSMGLIFTYIALVYSQTGQPALLYIVPCSLGTVILKATKNGHLKYMWNGCELPSSGFVDEKHSNRYEEREEYESVPLMPNYSDDLP